MRTQELEIYKTIEEYPDYMVSNMGNVKSLERINIKNGNQLLKERILKQGINKYGYCIVVLHKEGKPKSFRVHRLVATAFLPNPENKPHIDHIDTNKQNNNANNLRWCTQKENCNNPITKIKYSQAHIGKILSQETKDKLSIALKGRVFSQETKDKLSKAKSIPILQFSKSGNIIIKKWESARQVERELGIANSNISKCCKRKLKVVGGYRWMYYEDYFNQMNYYFELALKEVS